MQIISLIDKDKTKALNLNVDFIPCNCENCMQYYWHIKNLAPKVKLFFDEIGIPLDKCQELWCYWPNHNGNSHYSGYFKVALKNPTIKSQYSFTKDWENLEFDKYRFRIRLEYDMSGNTILGFEADIPLESMFY